MTLVRWNPARELASMEIDRLNNMVNDFYGVGRAWMPAVDIFETKDSEYVLKAELPDMKREDIHVTFENGVLTLTGERKAEFDANEGTFHRSERALAASAGPSRCRRPSTPTGSTPPTRTAC